MIIRDEDFPELIVVPNRKIFETLRTTKLVLDGILVPQVMNTITRLIKLTLLLTG